MRKSIFTFFICLLMTSCLMAQTKKRWGHFGLKTGLNYSTFRLRNTASSDDNEWRTGFIFGGFDKIHLAGRLALQPEFFYSSMGGDIKHSFGENDEIRLNYFSIPVLLKLDFCKNWSALLGPQVDFIIQGKVNKQRETSSFNETGFGFTGGLEYQLVKGVSLSGRYFYGLTNALAHDPTEKFFNHGAQFTVNFQLQ